MSLTDIMVLQAIFSASIVLFEFPSGYLADRVGYRTAMLTGASFWVAGWLLYAQAASFAAVAAVEVVLGAGSAFVSGADRALLWVSLESAGRAGEYRRWDGRLRATSQASEAASAALGGWLYSLAPRLPFWVQLPTAVMTLLSMTALRDVPRPPTERRAPHVVRALGIVRFTLWHHRRLRTAMAMSVALGLASFVMVWLIQPYMQARGIPPAWFGPIWAGSHLWLAAVSLGSARVVGAVGVRGALLGCVLLIPLGYAGLAASGAAWGVLFYLGIMTLRGLQAPILVTVMQEDAPPEDRASVLSLAALLFRLSFVLVGPPVGALVDRVGMDTALGVLAVAFTAVSGWALAGFWRAHGARAARA